MKSHRDLLIPKASRIFQNEHWVQVRSVRNDFSHGRTSAEDRAKLYDFGKNHLDAILESMRTLSALQLIAPYRIENGIIMEFFLCSGESTSFIPLTQRIELSAEVRNYVVSERSLLLFDPHDAIRHRSVYPFVLFGVDPIERMYLFQNAEPSHMRQSLELLRYLQISDSTTQLELRAGDTGLDVFQAFSPLWKSAMRFLPGAAKTATAIDPKWLFPSTETLVQDAFCGKVPRPDVIVDVDNAIAAMVSGTLVIFGSPGQGKTHIAASLIKDWSAVCHLVRRQDNCDSPMWILRSLLLQIAIKAGVVINPPCDEDALRKALFDALCEWSRKQQGINQNMYIVIDALDELEEGGNASRIGKLLFKDLPDHVYFVMTTRPGLVLDTLRQQLPDMVEYEVPSMGLDLIKSLVQLTAPNIQLSSDEWVAIHETSQGSPLYLSILAREFKSGSVSISRLPARVELFFDRVLQEANIEDSGLENLLALLCVMARAPSLEEFSDITGRQQLEIRENLKKLSTILLRSSDGRYRLFHKKLQEYLIGILPASTISATHQQIAAWCQRRLPEGLSYAHLHFVIHLLALGRREEAACLFGDVNDQTRNGAIESVVRVALDAGDQGFETVQSLLNQALSSQMSLSVSSALAVIERLLLFGWSESIAQFLLQHRNGFAAHPVDIHVEGLLQLASALNGWKEAQLSDVVNVAEKAFEVSQHASPRLKSRAATALAEVRFERQERTVEALDLSVEAARIAREDGLFAEYASATLSIAMTYCYAGRLSLATAYLDELVGEAQKRSDNAIHTLPEILLTRGEILFYHCRMDDARSNLNNALELSIQANIRTMQAKSLVLLGDISRELGCVDDARCSYDRALHILKKTNSRDFVIAALWGNAYLCFEFDDDWTAADRILLQLRRFAEDIGDSYMITCDDQLRAEHAIDIEDFEAAVSYLRTEMEACEHLFRGSEELMDSYLLLVRSELARAYCRSGELAKSGDLVKSVLLQQSKSEAERFRVRVETAAAEFYTASGRTAEADAALSRAECALWARNSPIERMRILESRLIVAFTNDRMTDDIEQKALRIADSAPRRWKRRLLKLLSKK